MERTEAGGLPDLMYSEMPKETEAPATQMGDAALESKLYPKMEESALKAEPGPVEGYENLTIPEKALIDKRDLGELVSFAEKNRLTPEQAQRLLDFGVDKIKATDAPYKMWRERNAEWEAQVKVDPEIGGASLKSSVETMQRVFQPGQDNPLIKSEAEARALKAALCTTGAGNNPAVCRLFLKIGRFLAARQSPGGGRGLVDKLYGSMGS
ncbi:MAG: hypothetical protein ACLQBD_01945 [Syntrophobacteraceae bacterium]